MRRRWEDRAEKRDLSQHACGAVCARILVTAYNSTIRWSRGKISDHHRFIILAWLSLILEKKCFRRMWPTRQDKRLQGGRRRRSVDIAKIREIEKKARRTTSSFIPSLIFQFARTNKGSSTRILVEKKLSLVIRVTAAMLTSFSCIVLRNT